MDETKVDPKKCLACDVTDPKICIERNCLCRFCVGYGSYYCPTPNCAYDSANWEDGQEA